MIRPPMARSWRYRLGDIAISLSGLLLLSSSTLANAANPAAPGAARFEIYSKTSAEIFWNRATDDGLVVAYEIAVNGDIIGNRDVLSLYLNTLINGQPYTVTITSIDNEGNRSAPASVSFVAGGGAVTPPTGNVVAAPTGLTGSVYSSKSVEIMWSRPATFGLRYEVIRNGSVVTTTSGVSHYERTLSAGTTYQYQVVAIDLAGNRSSASSISLTTSGGAVATPPSSNVVAAPTGLSGSVYSSKSLEIMWARPVTFGLSYEVSRNGSVVAATTGVSHYDNNLNPATSYTYQVVAINQAGNRSVPSVVMLNTHGGGSVVIVDDESLIAVVSPDIIEPADVYQRDGYGLANMIRLDVKTVTTPGSCTVDDQSGCTLADVLADIDKTDDLKVDIPIHVSGDDFPDDGSVTNAELRLRGGGSRFAPQKSFRIKLDSKQDLWRNERYLQLNKHPFDSRRIRQKLATDLMGQIPSLPSLRTQFVNLWIDDGNGPEDYGLFTHVERVNEHYLLNRGWNEDGNIYKADDFRFDKFDLSDILVDEDGKPLDKDRFETSLSIENGKDHRALQAMVQALNNSARTFESVLDQYFDRANALAWVATNIMLRQADAVRHNFILYNPVGTEKFYFVPWDYDETMNTWKEPPADQSNDSLRQRSEYGYGLAAGNVFLEGYYRLPGIHNTILQAVEYLHENVVTDQLMSELVQSDLNLVAPYQVRLPDSAHNSNFNINAGARYSAVPSVNLEALRTRFRIPIGPTLEQPRKQASNWVFSWRPAFDVTNTSGGISYRLQVAQTPTFDAGTVVVDISAIPDSAVSVSRNVDSAALSSGEYFARVIATPANEPGRFFQVSGNKLYTDSDTYYGVVQFIVD